MSKKLKDQLIRLGSKRKDLRPHIRPVLAELEKEANFPQHNSMRAAINDAKREFSVRVAHLLEERIASEFDVNTGRDSEGGRIDTTGGWSVTLLQDRRKGGIKAVLADIDDRRVGEESWKEDTHYRKIIKDVLKMIENTITDSYR